MRGGYRRLLTVKAARTASERYRRLGVRFSTTLAPQEDDTTTIDADPGGSRAGVGSNARPGPGERSHPWPSVAVAAEAIGDELSRGDADFALRLVARALAELRSVGRAGLASFLAERPSTGDMRWDTLLAGCIRRECRRVNVVPPPWTKVPPLPSWWFPVADPVLTARTMQRTPIDLAVLGIWLDGGALEIV